MEPLLILTGGKTESNKNYKIYNLVEFDPLERHIKLSDFCHIIDVENNDNSINDQLLDQIHENVKFGVSFLCKTDVYNQDKKYFNLGYYDLNVKNKLEIVRLRDDSKILFNKLMYLLSEECIF
jgi:hypothetical protein